MELASCTVAGLLHEPVAPALAPVAACRGGAGPAAAERREGGWLGGARSAVGRPAGVLTREQHSASRSELQGCTLSSVTLTG